MTPAAWQVLEVPKDALLWRYMSLDKFLSMLTSSELVLPRCDQFEDPWEATLPLRAATINRASTEGTRRYRRSGHLSCWHESPYQSAAMWSLYGASGAIAVTTTASALLSSLKSSGNRILGRVQYIDYELDLPAGYDSPGGRLLSPLFFFKRRSFEHEREVRLLETAGSWGDDFATSPEVIRVPIDLGTLVRGIYVSPTARSWLCPAVQTTVEKLLPIGLTVEKSNLYQPNVY